MMIFGHADRDTAMEIKAILEKFSATSGLNVNPQKTQVYFGAVPEETKQQILQGLGFIEGKLPVRYLGLPLISAKLTRTDCLPVIEKIKARINAWSTKRLTYAGRLLLVNAVLFYYQSYWSMVFLLPSMVVKEIEQMCRSFLWCGSVEKKPMALVAWDRICVPKSEGGLGVKQVRVWNRAALEGSLS